MSLVVGRIAGTLGAYKCLANTSSLRLEILEYRWIRVSFFCTGRKNIMLHKHYLESAGFSFFNYDT